PHALGERAGSLKAWAPHEAMLDRRSSKAAMAEDQWKRTGEKFRLWQATDLVIGGIPFRVPAMNNYVRPALLTKESYELAIPVEQECERVHFLGQVTFPLGYPLLGRRGETVAPYNVRYRRGREQELPVRSGIEVAQANLINEA